VVAASASVPPPVANELITTQSATRYTITQPG